MSDYRKAYTMREMKSIVDYLTEHRAFSEIKGRKMWVDFANSKVREDDFKEEQQ